MKAVLWALLPPCLRYRQPGTTRISTAAASEVAGIGKEKPVSTLKVRKSGRAGLEEQVDMVVALLSDVDKFVGPFHFICIVTLEAHETEQAPPYICGTPYCIHLSACKTMNVLSPFRFFSL